MSRYDGMLIVAAAIYQDGLTFSVPKPGRHWNVMQAMEKAGMQTPIVGEQGFLTSEGCFVRRVPARLIAIEAGQVASGNTTHGRELFSEDLW